jgi:MraZ protein
VVTEAFKGEFYPKVDSKARVSIPAPMRRILELADPADGDRTRARVIIVYGAGGKYAQCYSMAGVQQLYAIINSHPVGSKKRDDLETAFVARSAEVEIDEDGRIVLPPKVRARMGVTADDLAGGFNAAFAGKLDRFELWKADFYDAETPDIDSISDDIRTQLAPLAP